MRDWSAIAVASWLLLGCGSNSPPDPLPCLGDPVSGACAPETPDANGPDPELFGDAGGDAQTCVGLECQVPECAPSSMTTTLTGTVYAPNGTLPLYNAYVYVPNAPLDPISSQLSCAGCGIASGKPIAAAVTDPKGRFIVKDVPIGSDIPLVVQVGKWRRLIHVAINSACAENKVPDGAARLPRNRAEGDIPRMAVTTSACDGLACLLAQLGVDASEFGVDPGAPQRVVVYQGAGAAAPPGAKSASTLWNDAKELSRFDAALLSCECGPHPENKTSPDALRQYVESGGRVYATHEQITWARDLVGAWSGIASWSATPAPAPFSVDVTFPRGKAFADWLVATGGQSYAKLDVTVPFFDVGKVTVPTTRYLYAQDATLVSTFRAPLGKPPDKQCGTFTTLDMHVGLTSVIDASFPKACAPIMGPEERAAAFMLLGTTPTCITDWGKPPPYND